VTTAVSTFVSTSLKLKATLLAASSLTVIAGVAIAPALLAMAAYFGQQSAAAGAGAGEDTDLLLALNLWGWLCFT